MRDEGKLASTTVAGIEMIETIKASGAENGFFEKWAGYQASVNTQSVRFTKLNQYLGLVPMMVTSLCNTAVLILGVYLVMNGQFTIGMVMAFQGFLGSFMSPAQQLISAGQTMQEMITQIERVEDVMSYPVDHCFEERPKTEDYRKLTGEIDNGEYTLSIATLSPWKM
jgi:ABC-type bacteriocin/lantibiotic exporter with double-glycine peptidase domain